MSSENPHVPREVLSQEGRLLHYAITSLMEELEAIDWYRQRADDTEDQQLREILLHNMREEMEHASMVLEWIRRRNSDLPGAWKTYLFTDAPITGIEKASSRAAGIAEAGAAVTRRGPDHGRLSERTPLMDTLNRGHAPFPAHIWGMIDEAAASAARDRLTGRRFLDLGRPVRARPDGDRNRQRRLLPPARS